jgi:hypothetical protein
VEDIREETDNHEHRTKMGIMTEDYLSKRERLVVLSTLEDTVVTCMYVCSLCGTRSGLQRA